MHVPAPLLEAASTLIQIKYFVVIFPVAHHTAAVITLVGRCAAVEVQSKKTGSMRVGEKGAELC